MCQKSPSLVPVGAPAKTLLTLRHVSSTETRRSTRPFIRTLLVIGIIVSWVTTNKLLKRFHTDEWDKPIALGIALKSTWSFSLLVWPLLRRHYDRHVQRVEEASVSARSELGLDTYALSDDQPLSLCWRTVRICFLLMVLVQGASVTWIISVPLTSTSANSVLYQTQCIFAYVFSLCLLGEQLSPAKCGAVLFALFGASAVALSQGGRDDEVTSSWIGFWMVLFSAAFFALKEVLYKRFFPRSFCSPLPVTDACLCVGLIGACTAVICVPWLSFCDWVGLEHFELPPLLLARNYAAVALLMALQQTFVLAGVALTSPTIITISTIMTIPASMVWDFLLSGYLLPPTAIAGALCIVGAFLLVTQADAADEFAWKLLLLLPSSNKRSVTLRGETKMCRTPSAKSLIHSTSHTSCKSLASSLASGGSDPSKELV